MKKVLFLFFYCNFLLAFASACSCKGSISFIKEKYSKTTLIVKAKINSFNRIPTVENYNNHVDTIYWTEQTNIQVLEVINGKLISKNKWLAINGCNGFNCNECLRFYKVGDEVILMLSGGNTEGDYYVSNCGTHHAKYKNGQVVGLLNFSLDEYLNKRDSVKNVKDSLTNEYYLASGDRSNLRLRLKKLEEELHHYYNDDYRITQVQSMSYKKYKRLIRKRVVES
jgi:hypothetical protein